MLFIGQCRLGHEIDIWNATIIHQYFSINSIPGGWVNSSLQYVDLMYVLIIDIGLMNCYECFIGYEMLCLYLASISFHPFYIISL